MDQDNGMADYQVNRAKDRPAMNAGWDDAIWRDVPTLRIAHFHSRSSDHHPLTEVKLVHTKDALHVLYRVKDRYVKSTHDQYQDPVWRDTCVEIFLQPPGHVDYFNFEMSCGGAMLLTRVIDPTPQADGDKLVEAVKWADAERVEIRSTLPRTTPVEIVEPIEWRLQMTIPLDVMEAYAGKLPRLGGTTWRANLYKLAEISSHPHWATWAPIGEALNFHQPRYFGTLRFAE